MLRVKLWGTRGSVSTPVSANAGYGGNTPCIEVRCDDGQLVILDAGIGLHHLGNALMSDGFSRGRGDGHILISHTHWGHIQGIPFCTPMLISGNRFSMYGHTEGSDTLEDLLLGQMDSAFCPVPNFFDDRIGAGIIIEDIDEGEFDIGKTRVTSRLVHHVPGSVCLGFRLQNGRGSIAYIPDVEYLTDEHRTPCLELASDVDLLIHDSHHTTAEYAEMRGCGHATDADALAIAREASARRVILFHHHPDHSDATIDAVVESHKNSDIPVEAAREGTEYTIGDA